MKIALRSKNALIILGSVAVLFASVLLGGCKNGEEKQKEEVAGKVEAAVSSAQKMTDQDIVSKVNEIHQKKGTDPANMTPEERAIIGQALVKGLM